MKDSGWHGSTVHYYSKKALAKLDAIRHARTVIVEGPPGYGKTTAIRDRLVNTLPDGTPLFWLTATAPDTCFRRFARIICRIDASAGQRLLAADPLNTVTIGDACDAIRSIKCERETYLVIDNFHLLHSAAPSPLLSALVEHGGVALRLVLITHPLSRKALPNPSIHGFMKITAADLTPDASDIKNYFAQAGVSISKGTAMTLAESTGGWMAAISLQLKAFLEKGAFSDARDIVALLEHMVWNTLSLHQQEFLMRISVFNTVTVAEMCALTGVGSLPEYAWDALSCPFIAFEAVEQRYELNTILSKLLMQKRMAQGDAFNHDCLIKAGQMCRDAKRLEEAVSFFEQAKDYGQILSLDLSHLLFTFIGDISFDAIAWDVVQHVPARVKQAHLLSMLQIALSLLAWGRQASFRLCMDELRQILSALRDPPTMLAEWLLLESLSHQPQLDVMLSMLKQAAALFNGKHSQVILPTSPFGGGNCMPLSAYHIIPGQADEEADLLDKCMAIYTRITNGHGSGAATLYRAELAYHRGDLQNAEILAYQAACEAQSHQQSIVQLWTAQQLARIALHKADKVGWQSAIAAMERSASQPTRDRRIFQATLDISRGFLLAELHQFSSIADWLKDGDFSPRRLLPNMIPLALLVHVLYLLGIGESTQVIGITQARYAESLGNTPLLAELFSLVNAGAYMKLKAPASAVEYIHRAAEVALPDGLFFQFASFSYKLHGLSDELISKDFPQYWQSFLSAKEQFGLGWMKISREMMQSAPLKRLTARENEIARLAAHGLRNSEIAQQLSLSEATVRAHLRAIFQKLDIDRRAKLAQQLNTTDTKSKS